MKQTLRGILSVSLVLGLLMAVTAGAGPHQLGVGARYHTDHSEFPELPYDDGDISYGIAYEYHESSAYWQLALDYAPDVNGTNAVDYVLTPQINLLLKDNFWRGGVGALKRYERMDDGSHDWSSIFWQLQLGASMPIGRFRLTGLAFYTFDKWSNLSDFDFGDIEYGLWLTYPF